MSCEATSFEQGYFESLEIKHEGDFAVVSGLIHLVWTRNGLKMNGPLRFSKVWVRRVEGWRILHMHTTDARLGAAWAQTLGKPIA